MPYPLRAAVLATFLSAAASGSAQAHVLLDTTQAPALSYVRVAARVPHGCEGVATVALRMQIPEGVTGVKPQPKAGWTLNVAADKAAPAAAGHGAAGHSARGGHGEEPVVREVAWRANAGQGLADAHYDEFVLYLRTPDAAGQTLWFPFVQECEGGKVSRWIERPGEGQTFENLRQPAFPVLVVPRP